MCLKEWKSVTKMRCNNISTVTKYDALPHRHGEGRLRTIYLVDASDYNFGCSSLLILDLEAGVMGGPKTQRYGMTGAKMRVTGTP